MRYDGNSNAISICHRCRDICKLNQTLKLLKLLIESQDKIGLAPFYCLTLMEIHTQSERGWP